MFSLKTKICVLLLCSCFYRAAAQKWEFGISGGLALSKMSSDSLYSKVLPGASAGVSVQYNLAEKMSLRIEPGYILRATMHKKYINSAERLRFEYIIVPIFFQYEILPGLSLAAGPEANILTDVSLYSYQGNNYEPYVRAANEQFITWYAAAGAELNLGKWVVLHTRYEKSLEGLPTQSAIIGLRFIIDKTLFPKRKQKGISTPRYAPETDPKEETKENEEERWKIKIHGF